ncbi:hypothetical protein DXG01_001772 [Tephrocybe rancida]|nr:hypothetical protein DXG01_001772 [Tephrocybe rancida]
MPSELQLQTLFLPASSLPPLPLFVAITLCSELFSVEPMCVTVASNSEEDRARPEGTQPATNVASSGGVGAMQSMASTLPNSPTNQPQAPPIASATAPADIPQAPSAAQLPTPGAAQAAALILPPPHLLICLKKAAVYYSIIRGSQCGVFTDWLTVEVAAKSRNGSWKKHFSWVEAVAYYTEAWDAGIIAVV